MSQINTRGIKNDAVTGAKIRLSNNEAIRGRNAANTADIQLYKLNASDQWEFIALPKFGGSDLATQAHVASQVANYIPLTQKNAANGVATLDGTGKIPASQLPSYVDDIIEVANLAALPITGVAGVLYVTLDTNLVYRWSSTVYVEVSQGGVTTVNSKTGNVLLVTDDIPEDGSPVNLYHTIARARGAAVVNSTAGTETDQAPSVQAVKNFVAAQAARVDSETIILSSTDITNGYFDLARQVIKVLDLTPREYPQQFEGGSLDFTTSVVSSKTRITFVAGGDIATTLIGGDRIKVIYTY